MNSSISSLRNLSGESWAAIAGAVSAAFLFGKKLLGSKAARAELVRRAEFCTEMLGLRERMHGDHLALLEKLDANHRELLAAVERQALRINALESGLARVDERTAFQSPKSKVQSLRSEPGRRTALDRRQEASD